MLLVMHKQLRFSEKSANDEAFSALYIKTSSLNINIVSLPRGWVQELNACNRFF
jgi:hypothetical protein